MTAHAKLRISLLLMIFLSACAAVTPAAPTPTASASATPVVSFTPTAIPTATETMIPRSPIENYAQSLPAQCNKAFDAFAEPSSPDGEWTVYECFKAPEFFIINQDGSKAWHLTHHQLFDGVDGDDSLFITHWSNDSQYLYFTPRERSDQCCWDPIGGRYISQTTYQLWQFDLNTGKYLNLFKNIASYESDDYPSISSISFSPEGKTLLIIAQRVVSPPIVYVYDLAKDKVAHTLQLIASDESVTAGNVVWSADGQRFVLTSASGGDFDLFVPDEPLKKIQYSVIVIDLKKMSQKAILTNQKRHIFLRAITEENILLLESTEDGMGPVTFDQYDLTTNQFLTPLATPTP